MRFDRHSRRRLASDRKDHTRIVRLIGLLVLVVILIQMAARPESWYWLEALSESSADGPAAVDESLPPLRPIDVRRHHDPVPLSDDEFYAEASDAATTPGEDSRAAPSVAEAAERADNSHDPYLAPSMFEGVQDDWFGLTRSEQPALARISRHLRSTPLPVLAKHADRDVSFDALLNSPDAYRGRPLAIKGNLRRLLPGTFQSPDGPINVWEAYVIPSDSRQTPYLIFCNDIPPGLPQGDELLEPVTASAYFVRRIAYATRTGEAVTALLLAPSLHWAPSGRPSAAQVQRELGWGALWYVVLIALVISGLYVWFRRSDRRNRTGRLQQIAESRLDADPGELAGLAALDGGDPHRIQIEEPVESSSPT